MSRNIQQIFEHIFDRLYVGYSIHIKSREIIILFSMCRYAQSCAFISVIELPRIPAYCPKKEEPAFRQALPTRKRYSTPCSTPSLAEAKHTRSSYSSRDDRQAIGSLILYSIIAENATGSKNNF